MKGCTAQKSQVRITVRDSIGYTSFEVQCDRTKCNSPDTVTQLKAIFAKHNLTDANGRVPVDEIISEITTTTKPTSGCVNNERFGMVSVILMFGLLSLHGFLF